LGKGDLMILEMLSQCNWTRPIYVAITVGDENYMNLGDNTIQEGLAYRITPFTTKGEDKFDVDKTYDMMMNKFKYGGLEKPGLYLDDTVTRMCATHRRLFGTLITKLLEEGKNDKARKALEYAEKVLPEYNLPVSYLFGGGDFAYAHYKLGNAEKGRKSVTAMWDTCQEYLRWYLSLNQHRFMLSQRECMQQLYIMQRLLEIAETFDKPLADKLYPALSALMTAYEDRGGSYPSNL
jgi:hypothetical protein